MPRISVVMPVYNCAEFVSAAIESILAQSFADFEFIIVDDSTDETTAILHDWARRDSRIRLVRGRGQGISAALNDGLHAACGQWIARMDADDLSVPTRFERQLAYVADRPNCVAVGSFMLMMDVDGEPLFERQVPLEHAEIDAAHMRGQPGAIGHSPALIHRQVALELGGYREEFKGSEDVDLFLRLAERGRLGNVPEPLLKYRYHLTSGTFEQYEHGVEMVERAVRDARRRRGLPSPPPGSSDSSQDRARGVLRFINTAILAENYGPASKLAWRAFRMYRDWRMAAAWMLAKMRGVGKCVLYAYVSRGQ